jgi:hypothetical protein
MAKEGKPSLAEFAASQVDPRHKKWADDLPDDIKAQILAADGVPSRVIAECGIEWRTAITPEG